MTADERIQALMEIHPKGFDLSLGRITALLGKLGNPQDKLPPVIHVAGTNGKGSAIAFTRSILEAAGLSVHVHTSPHLVNWHERYRMGRKGEPGQLVDDATLSKAIEKVADANDGEPITVFEVLTVVTFVLFSENSADVCLIEVGLGGRFDATNVMQDVSVSVITPVSIDHEAFLGDTLAKIAFEKAGIIKPKTPLIVGPQEDEALAVIEKQAARHRAAISISGEHFQAMEENGRLVFQNEERLLDLPLPRLPGSHQISNAATAIAIVLKFADQSGHEISETAIGQGILSAQWPARMQHIKKGDLVDLAPENADIWLDGGHNPGAAIMIASFMTDLAKRDPRPLVMICGMLNTKDPAGYFEHFRSLVQQIVCVPIQSSDAGIPAQELALLAEKQGITAYAAPDLKKAIQKLASMKQPRILIAGSLYLAGDALSLNGTPPH